MPERTQNLINAWVELAGNPWALHTIPLVSSFRSLSSMEAWARPTSRKYYAQIFCIWIQLALFQPSIINMHRSDGSLRVWKHRAQGFQLRHSSYMHAWQMTLLVIVGRGNTTVDRNWEPTRFWLLGDLSMQGDLRDAKGLKAIHSMSHYSRRKNSSKKQHTKLVPIVPLRKIYSPCW